MVVDVDGDDETVRDLSDRYGGAQGPITVRVGGEDAIDNDREQLGSDLARAETLATGHARPAGARLWWRGGRLPPLAMAFVSVTGTLLALFAVAQVTDVSIYSINLTTALGLGLAIDYSLFIVSRFQEELAAGRSSDDAVVRTVETAGRTVAFSALIVAASLSALLVFPLYFLRSFAYAGTAVVLSAAAGALLTLPALLAVLGSRSTPGRSGGTPPSPAVPAAEAASGIAWQAR